MTKEQKNKCHAIIHSAATAAGAIGAGLAQLPCSDNVILVPIQIGMIVSLGKVFDLEILESAAQSMLATALTSTVGRGVSQVLVGWIPGFGNIINAATASGLTEAVGWIIAKDFDKQTRNT